MLSGLIFRLVKGSPLTSAEGDGNLRKIRDFVNSLEQLFGVVLRPNGTLKPGAVGSSDVLADGVVTAAKLAADAKTPAGALMDFAGTIAPSGWLECNGAQVSRATYAPLFAVIGTTWGVGDGSTTFNLPDMRRRVGVGSGGSGSAVLGNAVGNVGGAETVTLTGQESGIQSHSHTSPWRANTSGAGSSNSTGTMTDSPNVTVTSSTAGHTSALSGHNNLPPSAVVMKLIKT
jgi:microcystin-dependent protein